jgi:NTP pyrophosphatase (non-canonical NTP hydrolase)
MTTPNSDPENQGHSSPLTGSALSFKALRSADLERQKEWCPDVNPDLSFRGNELAGETGEACNVIKKLERERQGWRGSRDSLAHLGEELADVIIVVDLIASECGIDWSNQSSTPHRRKNSLSVRLQGPNDTLGLPGSN